jgi:hypothetical protein
MISLVLRPLKPSANRCNSSLGPSCVVDYKVILRRYKASGFHYSVGVLGLETCFLPRQLIVYILITFASKPNLKDISLEPLIIAEFKSKSYYFSVPTVHGLDKMADHISRTGLPIRISIPYRYACKAIRSALLL